MIRSLAFAAALLVAGPAFASDTDDITAAINGYNDSLNKGDFAGAAAYYTVSPAIIDEFAPHAWSGADAFVKWGADYGAYAKGREMTEPTMVFDKPAHVVAEGDRGYAVMPATFNFKEKGESVHEAGLMTFALQKVGDSWKIAAWSWSTK
jgi:ketosteroid isomerase-like protein